jgi:hypothetical protein
VGSRQNAVVEPDAIRRVIDRELALLSLDVRRSPVDVEDLLDPDFQEIGASGRLWTRVEMVNALPGGLSDGEGSIQAREMDWRWVGPDLILLTYVSDSQGRRARRSSLWRRSAGSWRLLHHQGTPLNGGATG